jgi:hypothetical protein
MNDAPYTHCDSCGSFSPLEQMIVKLHREGNLDGVRILSKAKQVGDCWEWQAAKYGNGYGVAMRRGGRKTTGAHRISYVLFNGEFDKRLSVLHKCDNPPCINPAHLFLGTHSENMRDMAEKGRRIIGSDHSNAKLTEAIVIEARERRRNGETVRALSKSYGVSNSIMCRALLGQRWAHVENPTQEAA